MTGLANRAVAVLCALAAFSILAVSIPAQQVDVRTVSRRLGDARLNFRVRVQSALVLGGVHDPQATLALTRALHDPHPAVRAACASSLARAGDRSALAALRAVAHDSSPEVRATIDRAIRTLSTPPPTVVAATTVAIPAASASLAPAPVPAPPAVNWRRARYLVVVGEMSNRTAFLARELGDKMRAEIRAGIAAIPTVAAVFDVAAARATIDEATRRRVPKMRIEGTLSRLDRRIANSSLAVQCQINLVLLDEPGRNMRGTLTGTATGTDALGERRAEQERHLAEQAVAGAARSALARVPDALARATHR